MFKAEKASDGSGLMFRCKLCEAVAGSLADIREHAIRSVS
jgi:hypothetical protein